MRIHDPMFLLPRNSHILALCLLPGPGPALQSPEQLQVARMPSYTFQTPLSSLQHLVFKDSDCLHPSLHCYPVYAKSIAHALPQYQGVTGQACTSEAKLLTGKPAYPGLPCGKKVTMWSGGHSALPGVLTQPRAPDPLGTFLQARWHLPQVRACSLQLSVPTLAGNTNERGRKESCL